MPDLHLDFAADPMSVRKALQQVINGLETLNLTMDELGTLELVLAEVMNNIVEHAYRERTGLIELRIRTCIDSICCEVSDRGAPMPGGGLPAGQTADLALPLADLPEGGFGWFLIQSLARDLSYRREDGRNQLRFGLPIGKAEHAP